MHILNIATQYWPYMGGAPVYVKEISERFVKEKHKVDVYTTNAWDLEYLLYSDREHIAATEEMYNGVQIKRFPVRHYLRPDNPLRRLFAASPLLFFKALFNDHAAIMPELWYQLFFGKQRYDIIHATPSPFYSLIYPAWCAARKQRIPFVLTPFIHTGCLRGWSQLSSHTLPYQISIMRCADQVIVQSGIEKKALTERGIDEGKITILGMGVNPDDLEGGDVERFRKRHGVASGEKLLAYVGALIYEKGSFHVLDVFRRLKEKGVPIKLAMAGYSSHDFDKYFNSQPSCVKESCILLGNIRGQEKKDLFHACDIFAMPSRGDSYGIVFLEAWLARKPVIGCYAGGIPEVISDGENGFLVPFGDVHMLGEYILLLMKNRELATRFGDKGYEKVISECTWDMRYQKIKLLFEGLITQKQ